MAKPPKVQPRVPAGHKNTDPKARKRKYVVLFQPSGPVLTGPQAYKCQATDRYHAQEQCEAAHPGASVMVVR